MLGCPTECSGRLHDYNVKCKEKGAAQLVPESERCTGKASCTTTTGLLDNCHVDPREITHTHTAPDKCIAEREGERERARLVIHKSLVRL